MASLDITPSQFFLLITILFSVFAPLLTNASPPALFILGDSTADVGTNNLIPESLTKANFPHNGIDFANARPTGRYSNGFNSADFLSKLMGFKRSPQPFLFLSGLLKSGLQRKMFRGVNFASGGSGLFDATAQAQKVTPLSEQLNQFITVRSNLTARLGQSATDNLLSKSIFCISIGSNDIFGYFATNSSVPKDLFISSLTATYDSYIRALYHLGARKFGIISVPPVGCCPAQRLFNATGGCLDVMNDFALTFHTSLESVLCNISYEIQDFKYSLGNTYAMTMNVIQNPALSPFKNVESACCGSGTLNAEGHCNQTATVCHKRSEYLFWDLYHPTQSASHIAAATLYNGRQQFVSPINFSQLAADS